MTIMVTGGDGYIGSHCIIALMNAGFDVVSFDNNVTSRKEISKILSNIKSDGQYVGSINGDLLKIEDINSAFDKYDIDAVIHFAALSNVKESSINPEKYYENNVAGTINLLKAMLSHNIRRIVFSSTASTYGNPTYLPIDEKHPQNPINPYGWTKLFVEKILEDYDRAYGIKNVILRYFNVIGADSKLRIGECHRPETHLIPKILQSALSEKIDFKLYGNDYPTRDGTCIRDYIDVEDIAEAHVMALNYLRKNGNSDVFNLGTNTGYTVNEIIAECEKVTGKQLKVIVENRRPGDPAVLIADNNKAMSVLGWEPKIALGDSIRKAYDWEKKKHGKKP